jgi:1-acyl-sn-glycerol-3-phosphate acyltransferase
VIFLSKHQSRWETIALPALIPLLCFVYKRELHYIPFFGWYAWKSRMIPVDRGKGSQALAAMTDHARVELARGRQIVIFPEGTRRAPGAGARYKYGVVHLYAETGVPCVPVALNSGLFRPRRSFRRFPSTIVVELPIRRAGLDKRVFFERLQQTIETRPPGYRRGRRELPSGDQGPSLGRH